MGGTCGTQGEINIYHLKDLGVDRRIILEWILVNCFPPPPPQEIANSRILQRKQIFIWYFFQATQHTDFRHWAGHSSSLLSHTATVNAISLCGKQNGIEK
jgi:hypothetical protein